MEENKKQDGSEKAEKVNTTEPLVTKGNDNTNDQKISPNKEDYRNEDEINKSQSIRPVNWSKQDIISAIGVGVSLTSVILMFFAITQTNKSLKIARQAIGYADSSFKIQNKPFLQVSDFKIEGDRLYYTISNLGQYPAKISTARFGINFLPFEVENPVASIFDNQMKPMYDPTFINTYVVKETSIRRFCEGAESRMYRLQNEEGSRPHFFGEIIYTNEGTNNSRLYFFNIKISGNPTPQFEFISNVNRDIN
jgi:hypothetical protein